VLKLLIGIFSNIFLLTFEMRCVHEPQHLQGKIVGTGTGGDFVQFTDNAMSANTNANFLHCV